MKHILFLILTFSYLSTNAQKTVMVYSEESDFRHQIYVGSSFPLRVQAGYELQYKRLQIGGFVGFTPKSYQNLVFDLLKKIQNSYQNELTYIRDMAEPQMQFGGELKLYLGKGLSVGASAQTFNGTITDTPKQLVQGILPEDAANISASVGLSAEAKNAYETKLIEASMNTVLVSPVIEKRFWLNTNETIFIRAKVAYWFAVNRKYDVVTKDLTPLEQIGVDSFRTRFINKLEKVSTQLQAPSFGLELGFVF